MTKRGGCRARRTTTAACAGVAILVTSAPLTPASAQAESAAGAVRVAVQEMSAFLAPGGRFTLRARLVSDAQEHLDRVQVRLRIGRAVGSRSELQQLARTPPADGSIVEVDDEDVPDELAPGDVAPLDLDIPAEDLGRRLGSANGVHPIRIEVRARVGSGSRVRVGTADTFLPWWPQPTEATRVAWVWPLTAGDRRGGDGRFISDRLAEELDTDGRLDTLLRVAARAADRVPLTWAIDPALVEAAADMADGYSVRRGRRTSEGGIGADGAARWLDGARAALSDRRSRTLPLPYGDPDVAALTRAGLRDMIGSAIDAGQRLLAANRFTNTVPDLSWPPDGAVDVPTVGVLTATGVRTLLVSDASLQAAEEDASNATPSAATTVEGAAATPVTVLAADGELSRMVGSGPAADGAAEGTRLALQRFVAETAFFTLERPSQSRDLVVAPPRTWNPSRAFARGLLDLTAAVPWVRPDVLTNVATRPRDDVDRFLTYPAAARARELPGAVLTAARVQRDRVEQFRSILVPTRDERPDPLPERLELALLRAASARFRDEPDGARALVTEVRDLLTDRFGKVSVAQGGLITMGGDTARLPITLVNDLDRTVRVQVRIETRNRLSLPEGAVREEVVAPGRRQLQVAARALVPGDFVVAVSLAAPDGTPLPGQPTTLRVRSSAYGRVALAITIGAFVLLLLGSAARLLGRRSRRRGSAEEAAA